MGGMAKDKILELSKGFRGRRGNCVNIARRAVEKALQYAYRDRRVKKRELRSSWILAVNAGGREHGVKYSEFIWGLNAQNITLNRKVLSEIAQTEPYSFKVVAGLAQKGVEQMKKAQEEYAKSHPRPISPILLLKQRADADLVAITAAKAEKARAAKLAEEQ
eukprot:GILJ01000775.1.p1 GENE.GILJ01000775.1~~GILJ01000775.1.p1  ORF type:complete len:162 (-),score=25.46 GILJ01000775.1:166-651(-)